MSVLVRTWNVFHGNASPPRRGAFLEEMVRLVTADGPDVVCLQEVPVWALQHLGRWSGMQSFAVVAVRPRLLSSRIGRWITELHHGLFRSAFTGEAVAILVARRHAVAPLDPRRVGPKRVLVRARVDDLLVGCFHVTGGAVAEEQFRRVVDLVADEPMVVLAGDANLRSPYGLAGWSEPLPGSIDQILVHGRPSSPPHAWPDERRRLDGVLLSDHAPVELTIG